MSRNGAGMSGANNIPLGSRSSGGSLAAAASSLGGVSLLNPSYLSGQESNGSPSSSSRRSKFGPPVEGKSIWVAYNLSNAYEQFQIKGIGPPPIIGDPGFFGNDEPSRKKPNMDVINSINAALKGKSSEAEGVKVKEESREERRRKRKSRWGGVDGAEKTFIPGMPTMMPQGLTREQEEAYLRKCQFQGQPFSAAF